MDNHSRHSEAKSKSGREASSSRRRELSPRLLPEPPKFYSKSYLKRYSHGKVKGGPPQQQQQQTSQASGKKGPPSSDDQARSQNSAVATAAAAAAVATTAAEISKNENPVNPYNRAGETSRPKQLQQQQQQSGEQDYRYSLVNAMSSIRSSYFKSAATAGDGSPSSLSAGGCDEVLNGLRFSFFAEDEQFYEWFRKIKHKVDDAVKRHKIFLIRGELPRLKEALEERGWIQKYEPSRTRSLPYECTQSLEARSLGDIRQSDGSPNERALTYALLRHVQPDFIWDCRNDFVEWDRGIAANVLLNRFHKPLLYTSKLGMAHVLQEAHWFHETNVADVLFPRSYNPSRELGALSQDFKQCAAVAVLRRFVAHLKSADAPQSKRTSENEDPPISLDRIEFAIRCCEKQAAELEHEDIDMENDGETSEEEWRLFSEDCERLLYKPDGLANLPRGDTDRLEACLASAQLVLEKLKNLDPQFDLNGEHNIWIVKPSNLCCGSGIFMTHDLKTILRKVESKPRDYYVVQKYIERPFLVLGTKFDIRQWFLVTSTYPMTIWMFKEALLRFSSRPYNFATYHEVVHLCNTAVQERYEYERRRRARNRANAGIGGEGMEEVEPSVRDQGWDCDKLNEYLKNEGYEGEPYWEKIYPKMSQAIVLTMLAAQDFMDRRRCSFELYGADFMVMENLTVWLIEINTNPRMHPPSSRITQRLYGAVLDSLVKVVMDLPLNPEADTGGFELAYRQEAPDVQPYVGPCFFTFGKSMTLHENSVLLKKKFGGAVNACSQWSKQHRASTAPPVVREPREVDLVDYLNDVSASKLASDSR